VSEPNQTVIVSHGGVTFKRAKKVALVGFASSSKDQAPFGDTTFDIWIMNDLYRLVPRWNRLFEMHEVERIKMDKERGTLSAEGTEHWKHLCSLPGPDSDQFCPVYTQEKLAEIPASVALPVEEMVGELGDRYFTSTPAYMMALAILDGYEEVHLYGIDLLEESEYQYQRPCLEYWLGVARGRGIKVYIPKQSALLKANYVYGFSYPPEPGKYGTIKTWLKSQTTMLENNLKGLEASFSSIEAVTNAIRMIQAKLTKLREAPAEERDEALAQIIKALEEDATRLKTQKIDMLVARGSCQSSIQTATACVSWMNHDERGGALQA
jgi:hypothetical protein